MVLAYLNCDRYSAEAYRSNSDCRFDGRDGLHEDGDLGSLDLTNGTWIWPERLRHYVEVHDVMLPSAFIEDAQREPRRSSVSFAGKRAVAE